jgi:uncharacterized protein YhaN
MRISRLELIRYGGYADRVLEFGSGGPDLHLVVGPNEAGKSTMLQAIGDMLFGIHGQSTQNWRYEYQQLRLRALIEHDGQVLDITRRKGNKDTLLRPDGTAYASDPLAVLLAGVDRTSFERMFGLDHAKLRDGGRAILEGKDDAARITLEAGSGMAGIGRELLRLEAQAADLFKSGGQLPAVNRLMRERLEALAEVRSGSISEADWTATKARQEAAEGKRSSLIDEGALLARRQAKLDRVGRARGPHRRLHAARAAIVELGDLPDLPLDAAARLLAARNERQTASEFAVQHRAALARTRDAISSIQVPAQLLAARATIEELEERRPVIENAAGDLQRRSGELERIEDRIAAARAQSGLSEDTPTPSLGWRKRGRQHLEARRTLDGEIARHAKAVSENEEHRLRLEEDLSGVTGARKHAELESALGSIPPDVEARLVSAESDCFAKEVRLAERFAKLAPWRGSITELRTLQLPMAAATALTQSKLDEARGEIASARKDMEAAESSAIRSDARILVLQAGGEPPTAEAVAAVRGERDAILGEIRSRLSSPQAEDVELVCRRLAEAIVKADILADRREAEAGRVADYGIALASRHEAVALQASAKTRHDEWLAKELELRTNWQTALAAVGFGEPMLPADLGAWSALRDASLDADGDAAAAKVDRDRLREQFAAAIEAIATALRALELPVPSEPAAILVAGRTEGTRLSAQVSKRERLLDEVATNDLARSGLTRDGAALANASLVLDSELIAVLAEVGMPAEAPATALFDALEALDSIAEDVAARDGLSRQITGMQRDAASFGEEVGKVLTLVDRPAQQRAADAVRALTDDLRAAVANEKRLGELMAEEDRILPELATTERRIEAAEKSVAELLAKAGVATESLLDDVVVAAMRLAELLASRQAAEAELVELYGEDLTSLESEIAGLSEEDEAAERSQIETRRIEIAAEREDVGRSLKDSEIEVGRASMDSRAADAQQVAAEASAALAAAAEQHVQAATSAALLRWLIDRHRATSQAPLIASAGATFAKVTGGGFAGLKVSYDNSDRAIIVGVRPDSSEVAVEGMSEGTRDQLYLSLRLASIAGRSGLNALPLICDDLLITADDNRASAMFRVLATAAASSQVILFSHHEHIIDIARQAIGKDGFRLHRLESSGSMAA